MMINIFIVIVLVVAVVFAIWGSYIHLKGGGACCGGGSSVEKRKKKLNGEIVFRKWVRIDGMVCENCKARVQNALNEIEGLSADVNLKKAVAKVDAIRDVSDDEMQKAVLRAGNYSVVSIKER